MFAKLPVAWLNLTYKPGRLLLSLSGIIFAAVLMFMFVGFKNALYDSQLRFLDRLQGDVFLLHSRRASLLSPVQFPASILSQADSYPGVDAVYPLYLGTANWTNPTDLTIHTMRLIAINPNAPLLNLPDIYRHVDELRLPNTVLIDRYARAEIGEKAKGVITELAGRKVQVVGNFDLGNDFSSFSGNLMTSEENFLRYQTARSAKQRARSLAQVDIGILTLADAVAPEKLAAELRQQLPPSISVHTKASLLAWELKIWKEISNIGFIFDVLTWMGFVIGIVLCYQILYADISDNAAAYATVRAMGYSGRYLSKIIVQQSLLLSILGFIPASIISYFLYQFAVSFTGLVFKITWLRVGFIFVITASMCTFSGLMSASKIQRCDPADVF